VEQRSGKQDLAISFRETSLSIHRGQRLDHHARVGPNIAFAVKDWVLLAAAHCTNPEEALVERGPIGTPFR
jgi:hypothetical protein